MHLALYMKCIRYPYKPNWEADALANGNFDKSSHAHLRHNLESPWIALLAASHAGCAAESVHAQAKERARGQDEGFRYLVEGHVM